MKMFPLLLLQIRNSMNWKIFYDPIWATAILDRFIHHCNFVVIDGESYRMKQRQEKLNGL